MHPGQGPGLSLHDLGETGGSETVSLLESEIPTHNHTLQAVNAPGNAQFPAPALTLARSVGGNGYVQAPTAPQMTPLSPQALAPSGGDQPHNNMMPYLTFSFCIALQGVFPPRG
jgi:microcystin-dependent protein